MLFIYLIRKIKHQRSEQKLTKKDMPYVIGMVLLDIAAPILLLYGLELTSAASVSLLNNFEIVMTAIIAFTFFKEKISSRLWIGIIFITLACLILSFDPNEPLKFLLGSLLVLLAAACWGLENNCTRKLSSHDPMQIVMIKGFFSGAGSLIIGFSIGESITTVWPCFAALGLGAVSYGLSIFFYIFAQRYIGAAKTSAYYAISPFIAFYFSSIPYLSVHHCFRYDAYWHIFS